ncbi:XRE family transcriptional regulator [Lacrimispora amygdalina]|uniref:XRE family transcriptional regulator n=1 Tax=Lacrimispora amygdalina TaxID=253257 RepID=A0A3E2NFL5_9FIRM|nr:helix-turn-helix transcriptional regulator [Clostridium indicum]RFZ79819.1 XRE family transcriptional regulator [Clostridium indicum]
MGISYNRLWKMLIDRKMKKIELQRAAGISGNVLLRLNKDEQVTMESLYKICRVLHCNVGDVMEFTDTEEEQQ